MKMLFALIAALLMSNAHAGVLYQWEYVGNGPEHLPRGMGLSITFSEAAVAAGRAKFNSEADCNFNAVNYFCTPDSAGGVESMSFTLRNGRKELFFVPALLRRFDVFFIDVGISANFINGTIIANDSNIAFWLAGVGNLFTARYVGSDGETDDANCGDMQPCSGATGLIRAIPEPSTISLLGLSLGALWLGRRKRLA